MKKVKFLPLLLLVCSILSCTKEESTVINPITGKWYMKQFIRNDSIITLDDCALMKSIEFTNDKYYNENYFKKDSLNICRFNGTSGGKWTFENGKYELDNGSLFDQKLKVWINNKDLYYSFEGWRFVGNSIQTSDIIVIYLKNN